MSFYLTGKRVNSLENKGMINGDPQEPALAFSGALVQKKDRKDPSTT